MPINDFFNAIDDLKIEPKVIFDIGARDCFESLQISNKYKTSQVYCFEANPNSYQKCLSNVDNNKNILIFNKAIHNYDGKCKFYPINVEKTITSWEDGNPGASSLFISSGLYDHIEKYVQDEIEVECCRIDTFCMEQKINFIDCVWMDLQGAEFLALQGMGEILKSVKVIHTELCLSEIYKNQFLFSNVEEFLIKNNFVRTYGDTSAKFSADFIYINKGLI